MSWGGTHTHKHSSSSESQTKFTPFNPNCQAALTQKRLFLGGSSRAGWGSREGCAPLLAAEQAGCRKGVVTASLALALQPQALGGAELLSHRHWGDTARRRCSERRRIISAFWKEQVLCCHGKQQLESKPGAASTGRGTAGQLPASHESVKCQCWVYLWLGCMR